MLPYPPGFRFLPGDDELLGHYLFKKIFYGLEGNGVVMDCDLYGKEEPWEIWKRYGGDNADKDLYFFTPLKKKSVGGWRIDRGVGASGGTWHEVNAKTSIAAMAKVGKHTTRVTGSRRGFTYKNLTSVHNGHWIMHEYSLSLKGFNNNTVLCRLRNNQPAAVRETNIAAPAQLEDWLPWRQTATTGGMLMGEPKCWKRKAEETEDITDTKLQHKRNNNDIVEEAPKPSTLLEEDRFGFIRINYPNSATKQVDGADVVFPSSTTSAVAWNVDIDEWNISFNFDELFQDLETTLPSLEQTDNITEAKPFGSQTICNFGTSKCSSTLLGEPAFEPVDIYNINDTATTITAHIDEATRRIFNSSTAEPKYIDNNNTH
ncbi:hypothetical protein K2173_016540 [Erythroxylum novogranatense]|uniref:NAC domain-containing protein n=1 Tax=Erythroxylum novogranatense TaxID=1862640 RepID=A0AAV8SH62_9ROSI|nr:hypothetical protein K2173_016540 [Erythroxylum novogranatense]